MEIIVLKIAVGLKIHKSILKGRNYALSYTCTPPRIFFVVALLVFK